MTIRTTMVIESETTQKNFDKKSMSFGDFASIDAMHFVMPIQELVLVHVNRDTKEKRIMVVSGTKFFNSLDYRTFQGKRIIIYRY